MAASANVEGCNPKTSPSKGRLAAISALLFGRVRTTGIRQDYAEASGLGKRPSCRPGPDHRHRRWAPHHTERPRMRGHLRFDLPTSKQASEAAGGSSEDLRQKIRKTAPLPRNPAAREQARNLAGRDVVTIKDLSWAHGQTHIVPWVEGKKFRDYLRPLGLVASAIRSRTQLSDLSVYAVRGGRPILTLRSTIPKGATVLITRAQT